MRRVLAAALLVAFPAFASADEYLGVDSCKTCHLKQYEQWLTTAHASSVERLAPQDRSDRACLSCHTMLPFDDRPRLAAVQCEACHGGGLRYAANYVMKDGIVSRLLGLEDVKEETCMRCHSEPGPSLEPFVFAKAIEKVRHQPTVPKE
ncbi:MAG: hypothetical protein HYV07_26650 [Deltaproteobacteria bacterium]|nr:hypothetical protein [Deltaproteobacteria bacterium]